ncbi:DNA/RNA non-specific endonuclease [soil metagenome]
MPRRYDADFRQRRISNKQVISLVITLVVAACAAYQNYERQHIYSGPSAVATSSSQMLLGNPSNAGTDWNNLLLVKPYFVVSYNDSKGEPNWVSWRLTKDDLGDAPRRKKFSTDQTLPEGMRRISEKDYTDSGFDRGHQCPHGDRTKNQEMSYSTFVMSNIVPQTPALNEKAWNMLEIYCRDLVKRDKARLYIVDGPAGMGATGSRGYRDRLAGDTVVVPAFCWKVIVVVPEDGTEDLTDVNANTRVIAVIVPNKNDLGYDWQQFRTSAEEVEELTGYKFFTALPPEVAAALRKKVDTKYVEPQAPPQHFN